MDCPDDIYRTVILNTNFPIIMTNPENARVIFSNDAFAVLFGYVRERIEGSSVLEYYYNLTDRAVILAKFKEKNSIKDMEVALKHSSGRRIDCLLSMSRIRFAGSPAIIVAVQDITELKAVQMELEASRSKYKTLFSAQQNAVLLVRSDGYISAANNAAEALFGHSVAVLCSMNILDSGFSFVKEDGSAYSAADNPLALCFSAGCSIRNRILGIIRPDREVRWARMSMESVPGPGPADSFSAVATLVDITTQRLEHEQLKESKALQDRLYSIIAHDLRSPFNAVLGMSHLISDAFSRGSSIEGARFEETGRFAANMEIAAEQCYRLLSNLLDWSRLQTSSLSFCSSRHKLKDIADEALGLIEHMLAEKDLRLEKGFDPDFTVTADYNMLSSVVRNLLVNAVKYSYEGGKIRMDAVREGDCAVVSIRDWGTGIESEVLKNLFSNEGTGSVPGTRNEGGTGLGLGICRDFIVRHGGSIRACNADGGGAVFTFSLPD